MENRLNVGIVGAGVAGCAAAIMLARMGHRVTVFEQSPMVGPVGAGVLLQPSGQAVLREMGLLAHVIEKAHRIDELIAYTHRGKLLSRLRYADRPTSGAAYGLHRGELFNVLHRTMLDEGVEVRLNQPVGGVSETGTAASLHAKDGSIIGTFDLVVAADGSRSRLRQRSGLGKIEHQYTPAAWWAVVECETVQHQLLQRTRGNARLCGLLPMGNNRCSFFWGTQFNQRKQCTGQAFDEWKREVLDLMPEMDRPMRLWRGYDDLMFTTYRAVYCPRVYAGRQALIGDAAHSSSPHLGQGINLALLDARDLCNAFRECGNVREALLRYDRDQRYRNLWYSLATGALTPTFQGSLWPLGVARDIALPLLQRFGPARGLMLKTLTGCG